MDDLLREAKERLLLEGQKAHIAINGAGAAALLAFLQAIWGSKDAAPVRVWVLMGILSFAVGTALAASSYQFRHWAITRRAFTSESGLYLWTYVWLPIVTLFFFVMGLVLPVFGAFQLI